MTDVAIVGAVRTAIGSFGGSLRSVAVNDLGRLIIESAISHAGIEPAVVDEVILGHVFRTGDTSPNMGRVAAIKAGLPVETPAFVLTKNCGSSMRAVSIASQIIKAGDADIMIACGVENMSMAAYLLPNARWGLRIGALTMTDQLAMVDPIAGIPMWKTAENVAKKYNITRSMQDEFALSSQQKAENAIKTGRFEDEIVPVHISKGREQKNFKIDEHPRFGTSFEKLSSLKPAFIPEGTVTAGNASGINDAASAIVLASGKAVMRYGLKPLGFVSAVASVGVDPAYMGIGPIPASRRAMEKAKLSMDEIGLVELNEAFASQAVYCAKELSIPESKLNVNGGAIALGHPVGASGCRLIVTLVHEMNKRNIRYGLATMCIGGGLGTAVIIERK